LFVDQAMKYGDSLTAVCWAVLGAKHKDVYPEMRAGMLESGLLSDVPPGYANPIQAEEYLKDATARGNIQASVILYKLNLNSSIPGFAAKAPAVRAAGEAYRNKLSETCKSVGSITNYDRMVKKNYSLVWRSAMISSRLRTSAKCACSKSSRCAAWLRI
jgi:hypothetical protein